MIVGFVGPYFLRLKVVRKRSLNHLHPQNMLREDG